MDEIRILVCGSRTWGVVPKDTPEDKLTEALKRAKWEIDQVFEVLDRFRDTYGPEALTIIQGGAQGADTCAELWCTRTEGVRPSWEFPADWDTYGRGAGHVRNQQMLDEGRPHFVMAFSYRPITPGTAGMVSIAESAGVPTKILPRDDAQPPAAQDHPDADTGGDRGPEVGVPEAQPGAGPAPGPSGEAASGAS